MASFGASPARGGKKEVDEGEIISAEEAQLLSRGTSNIKKERQYDVRWEGVPVRFKKYRDRSVQGGWRTEAQSLMPIWLRDLWPTHEFDPCLIWEKEKEKEAAEAKAVEDGEKDAAKTTKKKKEKEGKVSKKEQIQGDNAIKRDQELEEKDLERLKNCSKKSERSMLTTMKMSTPYGRLSQMLEILKDAVEANDMKSMFDVLWAIEALPLYQKGAQEEAKAKDEEGKEEKDDDKKKKKGKDDKKDKKGDKDKDKKKVKRSKECQLIYDHKKSLKKASKLRAEEDIVTFQLKHMADRLPPLSRFTSGWRLDEWQKRVLRVVDKRQSAIVCAPTSSGKTIISTYVTIAGGMDGRILFVVPTEPLVWQVAALFHKMLKGQVALCMDQMHFRPDSDLRVIVGTPNALETALSKLRGPVGEEAMNRLDYAQLQGGFAFDYAVYDEVHSLDGEEGAAMQRLIRSVNCNFLALSATIGNADQVLSWMNEVRRDHLADVEIIEAECKAKGVDSPILHQAPEAEVFLEDYSVRFINLQRWVWSDGQFQTLHPLSAVTLPMLQEENFFSKVSLPFTPRDTISLWETFDDVYPESKVEDLDPDEFFGKYEDTNRITLQMAKDYEEALCNRLELLAKEMPEDTEKVLKKFSSVKMGSHCKLQEAVLDMRAKDLCPAILFHLDTFKCLELFKDLLHELEVGQRIRYPNYMEELRQKAAEIARIRAQAAKIRVNEKEQAEDAQSGMGDLDMTDQFVDTAAPHPDFILSPPTNRVSAVEFDDICNELAANAKQELKNKGHPFLRALRRGFGIYIGDSSFPKYRRVIQRLAQQGKLAVVFSDESLAYGVNMPFRTCCFTSSMDGLLNPLLAQQMSGRAGRRGLDTQGNLVYMNMDQTSIQYLMLGTIPAMVGKDPHYPTVALQSALSKVAPAEPFPPKGTPRGAAISNYITESMARRISGRTLQQSIDGVEPEESYLETSRLICKKLGMLDEVGEIVGSRTLLVAIWELRDTLPESLAIAYCMDKLLDFFVIGKHADYAEAPAVQIEFCALLLMIIDRHPCPEGTVPLNEATFFSKSPEKADRLKEWEGAVRESQDRLAGLPQEDKMRFALPLDTPLDSRIFQIMVSNSFQQTGTISSITRMMLLKRLRVLGRALMVLHNVLMMEDPYDQMELLLRKTFKRVQYILADAVKEDAKQADATDAPVAEDGDGVEESKESKAAA